MRIPKDSSAGRREFGLQMEERRASESAQEWKSVRRGWCLGDEQFREELLEQAVKKSGEHHQAQERKEGVEQKAERIVREGLHRLRWTVKDLRGTRKGAAEKVAIARRLRRETTISLKWIAARLEMGAPAHAANRIYEQNRKGRV
jgi:hypothetical protein